MAKTQTDPLEAARARVAALEAEQSEPVRKLAEARAELERVQAERDAAERADALARLPGLEAPASVDVFKQLAEPLVAKTVEQLTALRETLLQCDQLVEQQEAVATIAQNAAASLGVPSGARVIGRGLIKGMMLDRLRNWGFFNAELYISFPRDVDRDNAILAALGGPGTIPPSGMTAGECARQLLEGRTATELHGERAAAERAHADTVKAEAERIRAQQPSVLDMKRHFQKSDLPGISRWAEPEGIQ